MAKAIETNPETLYRLIAQLKKEGILTWEGKKIVIAKGLWKKIGNFPDQECKLN